MFSSLKLFDFFKSLLVKPLSAPFIWLAVKEVGGFDIVCEDSGVL